MRPKEEYKSRSCNVDADSQLSWNWTQGGGLAPGIIVVNHSRITPCTIKLGWLLLLWGWYIDLELVLSFRFRWIVWSSFQSHNSIFLELKQYFELKSRFDAMRIVNSRIPFLFLNFCYKTVVIGIKKSLIFLTLTTK
jgi:hypothetical protein